MGQTLSHRLHRALQDNVYFDTCIGFVILLNCITTGLEAHQEASGDYPPEYQTALMIGEHCFTFLFTCELLVRFIAFGPQVYWPSDEDTRWNFLDLLLVFFTGVLTSWIIPLVSYVAGSANNDSFRFLTVLRGVRLTRLVRLVRTQPSFRQTWILFSGLCSSGKTLFGTTLILFFIIYLFAVFGCSLIGRQLREKSLDDSLGPADKEAVEQMMFFFGGLSRFMYTLVQILLVDSVFGIFRDLAKLAPWTWIFFFVYIACAVFAVMNLVTAVIVENALGVARSEEHLRAQEIDNIRKREFMQLQHMFKHLDIDEGGSITYEEFRDSFEEPDICRKWKLLDFNADEAADTFDLLDTEETGTLSAVEFFEGLRRMKGQATAKDLFRVQRTLDRMISKTDRKSAVLSRSGKTIF